MIDDVVGLVILSVVVGLTQGKPVTPAGVATTTAIAFGFLLATLMLGTFLVKPLFRLGSKIDLPGTPTILGVMLAFGLGWLAHSAGSAVIIGAFAAGLLLARTPQVHEIEHGVSSLGHFFVPLFFVSVGAAVDVKVFNPMDPANHKSLLVGGLLIVAAVLTKFAAGYAPFWFKGRKNIIGVGMIPRGEVGLIFAGMGQRRGRVRRRVVRLGHAHGDGHHVPRSSAVEVALTAVKPVRADRRAGRDQRPRGHALT